MDPNVFETANAGFAQVMYEEYLRNPSSVDPAWRRLFENGAPGLADGSGNGNGAARVAVAPPAPAAPVAPAPAPASGDGAAPPGATPIKGPAAKLVANMNESLTVPTATTFRELSVAALERQRRALNDALKAAGRREKVSFTHLIGWALVQATKQHPVMGTPS